MSAGNLAIWVNGAKMSYGYSTWENNSPFGDLKRESMEGLRDRVILVGQIIRRHHKKRIKGGEYWYLWENGKWISRGPTNKGDPRKPFEKELVRLDKRIKVLEKNIFSVIVKKYGDHLVVDLKLFRKFITKDLPDEMIPLRKLLGGKA